MGVFDFAVLEVKKELKDGQANYTNIQEKLCYFKSLLFIHLTLEQKRKYLK